VKRSTLDFPETPDIASSSEDYARRFSGEVGDWFLRLQARATLKMLEAMPGASVLDVGGGHGQLAEPLIQQGYRVTVLGSAQRCRQRIHELVENGSCAFKVGNLLDIPYEDRAFDVVISYRVLSHLTNWERFLEELCRVADKAVVVDYAEKRSINAIAPLLFRYKKRLEKNTRPFTCYRQSTLLSIFRSLGYIKAGSFPQFFFPMALHRALQSAWISARMEHVCRGLGLTALFGSPVILKLIRKDR
jgi:SAM-dependent methyltransferase